MTPHQKRSAEAHNDDPKASATNTILHFADYILCHLTQNAYGYILLLMCNIRDEAKGAV